MRRKTKSKTLKNSLILGGCVVVIGLLLWFLIGRAPFLYPWQGETDAIKAFSGVYEPSAAQQLNDGKLIVLEDEVSRALNLLRFGAKGQLNEDAILDKQLNAQLDERLDDLEGIAIGQKGEVYATTSFSRTRKGKRRTNREKLVRLVFDENGQLVKQNVYKHFAKSLNKSGLFSTLNANNEGRSIALSALNIEGLSFDADKQQLLFGLKKPLVNDLSVIIYLNNPEQVLDGTEEPLLAKEATLLDLQGGGIRSLCYVKKLQGYLIANEVDYGGGPKQSQLWFWQGADHQPVALTLPEIAEMENIEAVSPVIINGKAKVLVMSDDGSRRKKQPAHYSVIEYNSIQSQLSH
ncbi:MAG: hypothetical protein ACPG47_03070 [Leucothrix sp.]